MKFYAFTYGPKKFLYCDLMVAACNTVIGLAGTTLSYALAELAGLYLFDTDFFSDFCLYYICILTAAIIAVLEIVFYRTDKGVILQGDTVTIKFGFIYPGGHRTTRKLNIKDIKEAAMGTERTPQIQCGCVDVFGGNYQAPYLKIYFGKRGNYILPIENGEDFIKHFNLLKQPPVGAKQND